MVVAIKAPTKIVKRSGLEVDFDQKKIHSAIFRCYESVHGVGRVHSAHLDIIDHCVLTVMNILSVRSQVPTVEMVQDLVIWALQSNRQYDEAEHYIIYRHEHAKLRAQNYVPPEVIEAYKADDAYFPTPLQRIQFINNYSRWLPEIGRRETWVEAVNRAVYYLMELADGQKQGAIPEVIFTEIRQAILNMEIMPSMRLMAMAGDAARRDNAVLYNCSYLPLESIDSFCELMHNSMAGCGVGYSVEYKYVSKLPKISKQLTDEVREAYTIQDSAEGWVEALRVGLFAWFKGLDISFDYSLIRPKGSPLHTKGGRASGPEPLRKLLLFIRNRVLARQGKKLTTLDCHDIACAIGNAVVSGGVRRSAMISLFDSDDNEMMTCKSGDFERENSQRWNANNSAVWTNVIKMTQEEFVRRLWTTIDSQRGEPGIFSREIATNMMTARRREAFDVMPEWGTNPCGEISLKPYQFCNLSAVIARPSDTPETLQRKVRLATIIGTIQSLATYFPNLRSIWKVNCEQERLLGVDITGQCDTKILDSNTLYELKKVAIDTNIEFANLLGINPSASITCVKPSGNTSQLVNCASGLHPRWAPYYIRRVRVSAASPVAKLLLEAGVPMSTENGDDPQNPTTYVASFPIKSPDGALTRKDVSAIDQCEIWLKNKLYWTEHNPSVTITYSKEEVLNLMNWLWRHRTQLGGLTIFPKDDGNYAQLPYEEITKDEYEKLEKAFPKNIDFSRIYVHEKQDMTTASETSGCDAPICELSNNGS